MQEGKLLKSEMVSRDGEMFYVEKVAFIAPGQRHRDACDNAFTAKRLKWLFSLKK